MSAFIERLLARAIEKPCFRKVKSLFQNRVFRPPNRQPKFSTSFYLLGFVGADIIKIEKDCWFAVLTSKQVNSFNEHLSKREI
jgi:hypothetical protein